MNRYRASSQTRLTNKGLNYLSSQNSLKGYMTIGVFILGLTAIATTGCGSLRLQSNSFPQSTSSSNAEPRILPTFPSFAASKATDTAPVTPEPDLPTDKAAEACIVTARKYEERGLYNESIKLYERARTLSPKAYDYSKTLAVLYELDGQTEKAKSEYLRAIAEHPKDPELLNNLGYFYYKRRDFANAETHLSRALQIAPNHERATMNLAMVLAERQEWEQSYNLFTKVVSPSAAHSNLGVVMAGMGLNDMAMKEFQIATTEDPSLTIPAAFMSYLETSRMEQPELR